MPRNKLVLEECNYRVKPTTPITITIKTGDGQVSGTSARFENEIIDVPEGTPVRIGTQDQNLSGLSMNTISVVKDIALNHDHTSITIELSGGIATEKFEYAEDAYGNHGMVVYDVLINFIS